MVEVMKQVVEEQAMVGVLVEGVMEVVVEEVTMPVLALPLISTQMLKQIVEEEDTEMVEAPREVVVVTREVVDGLGMVVEVAMVLVVEVVTQIKIVPVMPPSAVNTSSAGRLHNMGVMARQVEVVP